MIKELLTFDERLALGNLVELCRDLELLVNEDDEDDCLITTGKELDLRFFDKDDWALCLKALED